MEKLIRDVRKKHTRLLFGLLGYLFVSIAVIVLLFLSSLTTDKKLSLLLVVLILMLFLAFWFKPRFYYYTQQIKYLNLKKLKNPPLKISSFNLNQIFLAKLTKNAYQIFTDNDRFLVFHRYTQDNDAYVTKKTMLEILIFIKDTTISFQADQINKTINLIEDDYAKKKIKYTNYSIIEIKHSKKVDEANINEVDNITFDVESGRHISVILVYIDQCQQEAHFLYSDLFTPNIYYSYAVNLVKEILK